MMVYTGEVDGLVSGAVHSTANTVRPALQIIKTKPGVSRTSGAFIMQRGDERYLFADTAINIDPNADELAEIAVESAATAKAFGIDPRVAMLSFSTKGSAAGDMVTKVQEATAKAQALAPEIPIDGEMQFDAAFVPSVGAQKHPTLRLPCTPPSSCSLNCSPGISATRLPSGLAASRRLALSCRA